MNALRKVWHWVKWPLIVLVALFIIICIYFVYLGRDKYLTEQAVARIHAQKVSLSTVMGDALPPKPYGPEADSTLAGIDKNNNGIRDDVELAIFAKYPHSAKIRAAELQYAMTEQMFITDVFNTKTWKAVAEENSRGYQCVSNSLPYSGDLKKDFIIIDARAKEVEDWVLNTQQRKDAADNADTYTTSFGSLDGVNNCDIDLNSLSN